MQTFFLPAAAILLPGWNTGAIALFMIFFTGK